MSWVVNIDEVVLHVARCAEIGCTWQAAPASREDAETFRDAHVAWHRRQWTTLCEQWEANLPARLWAPQVWYP